jgi:hypothetical protein
MYCFHGLFGYANQNWGIGGINTELIRISDRWRIFSLLAFIDSSNLCPIENLTQINHLTLPVRK